MPNAPTPIYVLSCGWYHRPDRSTNPLQPGWTPVLTWLATPDLGQALAALDMLQQQGYDACGLTPLVLGLTKETP